MVSKGSIVGVPISHLLTMYHIYLNVKLLVGALNQEKAIVGAFSVIVRTNGSFAALLQTLQNTAPPQT